MLTYFTYLLIYLITLLYFTLLYFTLLYFTLLYFTLLYFTLLYFTLLYSRFLTTGLSKLSCLFCFQFLFETSCFSQCFTLTRVQFSIRQGFELNAQDSRCFFSCLIQGYKTHLKMVITSFIVQET